MKKSVSRLLWTLALLLLAAVLVFVNLPEAKPVPPVPPPDKAPAEAEALPRGSQPGEELPDFTVRCLDGSEFSLSAQRGKVVVINLWATWCTPCVKELPDFDRLQREHPDEVAVLALHSPPVTTDVQDWLSAFSYEIPFAVDEDGSVGQLLNASTILPQTVIVGPTGVVSYNQSGALGFEKLLTLVEEARG